ncbi:MAG: thioredoxin family protein [Candidatus Hydrothermarchaeales archaeon]
MKPKKVISIAALVTVMLFIYYSINASPLISDANYTYISGLTWYNTYEAGKSVAEIENKPILLYVWAMWCRYCEKLHTEVYPDPEIYSLLTEHFVLVAVDLDTNRGDANKFGISYPPHLLFLTRDGDTITRIPGYVSVEQLAPILRSIAEGHQRQLVFGELPHS